jgi:hypothetical protein
LSRRLGDDPLTRARSKRAKAAESSGSAAPAPGGEEGAAQVGVQTVSRASYNDVFFQRRGEAIAAPQAAAKVQVAPEAPEISEISEIPEIREAAVASGNLTAFEATADVNTVSEGAHDTHAVPAPPASVAEDVVADLNAQVPATGPTPEIKTEPASSPASSQAPAKGGDESKAEPPKSGGFFKRLFGKFK